MPGLLSSSRERQGRKSTLLLFSNLLGDLALDFHERRDGLEAGLLGRLLHSLCNLGRVNLDGLARLGIDEHDLHRVHVRLAVGDDVGVLGRQTMDETGIAQEVESAIDRDRSQTLLLAAETVDQIVSSDGAAALDQFAIDAFANRRESEIVLAAQIVCTTEEVVLFFFPEGLGAHEPHSCYYGTYIFI